MEIFTKIEPIVEAAIAYLGIYGPILGCILMCVESILPFLPLSVFITLNFYTFGNIIGFFISWICKLIGCAISFWIFRKSLRKWFEKKFRIKNKVNQVMNFLDNSTFQQFVVVVAMPFTPAFVINIAAGLSQMPFKKFILSLALGKAFMVYFWGFVGTSLLNSLKDPTILIQVFLLLILAYVISKLLNKKFDLD